MAHLPVDLWAQEAAQNRTVGVVIEELRRRKPVRALVQEQEKDSDACPAQRLQARVLRRTRRAQGLLCAQEQTLDFPQGPRQCLSLVARHHRLLGLQKAVHSSGPVQVDR